MPENPSNHDAAQATTTAVGNASTAGNESSIIDRTQQLIDEVNQLLGAGTGIGTPAATPPAPVATSSTQPVVETAQAEPVIAPSEPVVPQVANVETPPVEVPAAQAPAAQAASATAASPTTATSTAGSETADLSSFLNELMGENPLESASQVANVEQGATPVSMDSGDPTVTPTPVSEATVEPAATPADGFDIDALNSVFGSSESTTESIPTESVAVSETPFENLTPDTTNPEIPASVAAEAPVELPPISTETSDLLKELNILVDTPAAETAEPVATEPVAVPVTTEAVEDAIPMTVEDTEVQAEVPVVESSVNDAAEETEEEDSRSFTEKYLEQFRSSLEEDVSPEEIASASSFTHEPVAATPSPAEPEAEEPKEPDSAELSVENWLAKNIGSSADGEDEDEAAESTSDDTPVVSETTDAPETVESMATVNETPEEEPEEPTEPAHDFASLEASYTRQIRSLEKRIRGMFASLSSQLNGGVAMETAVDAEAMNPDDVSMDQFTSPDVDGLKAKLEEKLRKAEVELSINRAKISQQTVQLEQMQADLERREAALEQKLQRQKTTSSESNESSQAKGSGLMDRWKRHLG